MERDIEKSTLDALALVSIMAMLTGAVVTVAGASWRFEAYFTIVGTLFDIVFTYDFFVRLQNRNARFPWLAFVSSVLPLAFVSGPFLSGWAFNELGAAAVRGFWLGTPPASGLSILALLRLLRVTRPFSIASDSGALRGPTLPPGYRAAAIVGITAVLAGAFASDALLIPGPARASEAHRAVALSAIASALDDEQRVSAAHAAPAVALRILGRPLLGAPADLLPADYMLERSGGIEAWFPVADERRSRGAAIAITSLAALAAATGYALACRRGKRAARQPGQDCGEEPGDEHDDGNCEGNRVFNRPEDVPAGTAELTGILGKRPH